MAFKLLVVAAALVALVSAGMDANYMNYMQQQMMQQQMMQQQMMQQQQQQQMGGNGGNGCDHNSPGGCQIPTGIDLGDYLQQQMNQQRYDTEQMAAKVKDQFESVMKEVTMKKHRYAMTIMTEFTSMCACANEAYNIYQGMFVANAKALNLTDVEDLNDKNYLPYEAKTAKDARELMFNGMFYALCTSLGEYFTFVEQVEQNIPIFEGRVTTAAPVGK